MDNSNRTSFGEIIKLQKEFSKRVIARDDFDSNVEFICGVDVSYRKKTAYCSAVIINKEKFEITETASSKSEIKNPYIPGLFILRESAPYSSNFEIDHKTFSTFASGWSWDTSS